MYFSILSSHPWRAILLSATACLLSTACLPASEGVESLALLQPIPLAELQALASGAVEAGFPDAASGELLVGELRITSTTESHDPLEQRYYGLHIALPDGIILRNLQVPVRAGDNFHIDRSDLRSVKASSLEEMIEHLDPRLHAWAARSLDSFLAPTDLDLPVSRALMSFAPLLAVSAEILNDRHIDGDRIPHSFAACLHLTRLGLPDSGRLLVPHALSVLWRTDEAQTWPPRTPLLLMDELRFFNYTKSADFKIVLQRQLRKPPLPLARYWAMNEMLTHLAQSPTKYDRLFGPYNSWHHVPPSVAQRLVLDWAEIDGFRPAAADLLAQYENAFTLRSQAARPMVLDFSARVARWRPPRFHTWPHIWTNLADEEFEFLTPGLAACIQERSHQLAPPSTEGTGFGMHDMDGLMLLLDSEAPSAWIDEHIPRSLGDQALRLMTSILSFDPRLLVDISIDAPWTPELRQRSAVAIRAWWATQTDRDRLQVQILAAQQLSDMALYPLISENTDPKRMNIFRKVLTTAWQKKPPHYSDDLCSGSLLAHLSGDLALNQAIAKGSFTEDLCGLEACWHAAHGNVAPAESLLTQWSAPPFPLGYMVNQSGFLRPIKHTIMWHNPLQEIVLALSQQPDIEHFLHIRRHLDGQLDQAFPVLWLLNVLQVGDPHYLQGRLYLQKHTRTGGAAPRGLWTEKTVALPLMLYIHLLEDQRELPPALRELLPLIREDVHEPLAHRLRVCDLALASSQDLLKMVDALHNYKGLHHHAAQVSELLRTIVEQKEDILASEQFANRKNYLDSLRPKLRRLLTPILREAQLPDPFAVKASPREAGDHF